MASYQVRVVKNQFGWSGQRLPYARWWRCNDYQQNDDYLATYAPDGLPRWIASHWVFGFFNTEATPEYTHGSDGPINTALWGPVPFKVQGVSGSSFNAEVKLEIDCKLVNGATETVAVTIPAGFTSPSFIELESDCVPSTADGEEYPWVTLGLYIDVTDIRYAADYTPPEGLVGRIRIANDVPGLRYNTGEPLITSAQTIVVWDTCFLEALTAGAGGADMCHGKDGCRYAIFWSAAGLLRFIQDSGTGWTTPVEVGSYPIPYNGGAQIMAGPDGTLRITLGFDTITELYSRNSGDTWVEL